MLAGERVAPNRKFSNTCFLGSVFSSNGEFKSSECQYKFLKYSDSSIKGTVIWKINIGSAYKLEGGGLFKTIDFLPSYEIQCNYG